MRPWIWLDERDARAVHDRSLVQHGGAAEIRDVGLLASALARPQQLAAYGERVDAIDLAATYTCGLVQNHPFVDGNKRTALVVSFAFLDINGISVKAAQEDAYTTILGLAAGEIDEEQLADWFERNSGELNR